MKQIRFLHLADLHFDRAFHSYRWMGESVYQAMIEHQKRAFIAAVDFAIQQSVDFVLICGDLFDHPRPSLQLQFFVKKQLMRLAPIQVYIQHGNHDPYQDYGWDQLSHIHIFQKETVESFLYQQSETPAARIYGFSYQSERVLDRKIRAYHKTEENILHIAMLHGSNEGETTHAPYAPFSLEEMLEKNMDYYALGHIHKRQMLHNEPPIVYSGSIIGLHKKETGAKGGVYVSLSALETKVEWVDFAEVEWMDVALEIDCLSTRMEWVEALFDLKEKLRVSGKSYWLRISLIGRPKEWLQLSQADWEDIYRILNEEEDVEQSFVFVMEIQDQTIIERKNDIIKHDAFYIEWQNYAQANEDIMKRLQVLFRKRGMRKHFQMEDFSMEEIEAEARRRIEHEIWGVNE